MGIEDATALSLFPFSHLALSDDEIVQFTQMNPTFHRPDLQAVLLSNKALYLGQAWQDRVQWRRFALTEIQRATLIAGEYSAAFKKIALLIGCLSAGLCLFAATQIGMTTLGSALLFYGVPTVAFMAWMVWQDIRSQRDTCALRIETATTTYVWRMPGDSYAGEKAHDCGMVKSTLEQLAELGVQTGTEQAACPGGTKNGGR